MTRPASAALAEQVLPLIRTRAEQMTSCFQVSATEGFPTYFRFPNPPSTKIERPLT